MFDTSEEIIVGGHVIMPAVDASTILNLKRSSPVSNTQCPVAVRVKILRFTLAVAAIASLTGCTNLGGLSGFSLGQSGEPAITGPNGVCTVEVYDGGKPTTTSVPLTAESRVQDVLESCSASKRFAKMKVQVVRQSPRHPEEQVRLSCQFDPKSRRISMETDYALMSGDRIVVVEDNSSKLDKTLGAILPF